ncbi:MAG: heavy-metal-associated domain-containing protein [Crocinitomicaceae bacterium]|nr:heavy-metal-associated domain-containing protein [Crocinitomicaceae bacterium]
MKNSVLIMSLLMLMGLSSMTNQNAKTKTITFITTAICGECKERIEDKLNYTKGVVFAELNLENKMLTVKYKTEIITDVQIKEILANLGYSSDTVVRNHEAYLALPKCCRGAESCEPGK